MKNRRMGPRLVAIVLLIGVATCLWMAGSNLWAHLRMRTIAVEVVHSSLLIDATGKGNDLDLILRLDLKTTDGSGRTIHWEEGDGPAAYPEEGYDELRHWAPGTRHQVYQLRGQAEEIRLPDAKSPELVQMIIYLFLGVFTGFFAFVFSATLTERSFGVWLVFFLVGVGAFFGAGLFAWFEIPKRLDWPSVVATLEPAPAPEATAEAQPRVVPENVVISPAAQQLLGRSSYKVLRFNGLHAGLGGFGGRYDVLKARCESGDQECRFVVNPHDRWDVEPDAQWDGDLWAPLAIMAVFGLAFCGAGLLIRRFGA